MKPYTTIIIFVKKLPHKSLLYFNLCCNAKDFHKEFRKIICFTKKTRKTRFYIDFHIEKIFSKEVVAHSCSTE